MHGKCFGNVSLLVGPGGFGRFSEVAGFILSSQTGPYSSFWLTQKTKNKNKKKLPRKVYLPSAKIKKEPFRTIHSSSP